MNDCKILKCLKIPIIYNNLVISMYKHDLQNDKYSNKFLYNNFYLINYKVTCNENLHSPHSPSIITDNLCMTRIYKLL